MMCVIPTTGPACNARARAGCIGIRSSFVVPLRVLSCATRIRPSTMSARCILHDVAPALSRVEQERKRKTFAGTEGPSSLELSDLSVGPGVISAKPIRREASKRIVSSDADFDRVGYDLGQHRLGEICHTGPHGPDLLDHMSRRDLGQIADEPVTVCGENGFQRDLVRCLRRRRQVGEIGRSQITCCDRG